MLTIKDVSKEYGLSQDTIRYYERIGLVPPITRDKNGIRNFTEEDRNWVNFVKCMRSAGLSIETLISYVTLFQKGNSTIKERKQLLVEQRIQLAERIQQMNETLERLDSKIEGYEERVLVGENKLRRTNTLNS